MYGKVKEQLQSTINEIREAGLYKSERVIEGPQDAHIDVNWREVLNMCANNYLGLSDHPAIVEAARKSLDEWGYGLSSVRFICGTQAIHKELERKISEFLGTEDLTHRKRPEEKRNASGIMGISIIMKPRIIYLPFILFTLLAMWTTSSAQQTAAPEKQKLVMEFRKLTGADNVNLRVNLSFEDVRNDLVAIVDKDKDLTDEQKQDLGKTAIDIYNGLDQQLKAFLNDQAMITPISESAVFQVYDKAFTESELKELIAFYSTATGQKALKFLPTLSNQVGQLFQSMLLPKVQEFIGPKIRAETDQMKQRIADAKARKPE